MTDQAKFLGTEPVPAPDFSNSEPRDLAFECARILLNKKGSALKVFSVADVTVIADYYVIVTGRSSTQIKALADDLVYEMERRNVPCAHLEGRDGGAWILCDFGCVIVHVFDRESREYYNLERLIPPESEVDVSSLLTQDDGNGPKD